jgi:hypothetical protein
MLFGFGRLVAVYLFRFSIVLVDQVLSMYSTMCLFVIRCSPYKINVFFQSASSIRFLELFLYSVEATLFVRRNLRGGLGEVPQKIGGPAIGLLPY